MRKSIRIPLSQVRIICWVAGSTVRIRNKRISLPGTRHINLIDCFLSHAGRVVSYETLSTAMKWRGPGNRFRHNLRQYILQLKMILHKENVYVHFAVAEGVGYALCKPAKD
jgi:DNA-binding response OmpR family regulator